MKRGPTLRMGTDKPAVDRVLDITSLIEWYWPVEQSATALSVAHALSGLDPFACDRAGKGCFGLFQLRAEDVGAAEGQDARLDSPIVNVGAAYRIWRAHGWEWFYKRIDPDWKPLRKSQDDSQLEHALASNMGIPEE
jgi:hypothetical protein